ncbi:unnamed protein product [Caenorhabditis angaria]|uniref:non-specific serine/threonine protein kinase n=1 Tax=Caenorhabditis angaria TaxID=860376 RepID=A0A9P1IU70_9PELO|nr:unnamed protein product [Caenorhabditis angaria]
MESNKIDESSNAKSCSKFDISLNNHQNVEKIDKRGKGKTKGGVGSDSPGKSIATSRNSLTPRIRRTDRDYTTMLPIDEVFRKRWHVEGIIGKGGYGEIYLAIDMKRTEEVAIKVLVKMQGKPHVPLVFASGHTDKINFFVMQLLSINLGELRRSSPVRKLSKSTTGRILIQAIAALRDLHDVGYIHRDVKAANMCFGITPKNRHVLMLVDFGLIRRYKCENGEWREQRSHAGFRGTHRYVSVRVHSRMEQTPSDDIVSLLYTGYELMIGDLPWKNMEKSEDIRKLKEAMQHRNTNYFATSELSEFAKAVFSLDFTVDPPYKQLQNSLKSLIGSKKLNDLYDWEEEYKEAIEESHESDHDSGK